MRILAVEDEARLGAALRRGLQAEGFVVDVAVDGVEGLWLARERPYDAIILDILLPKLSGYRVCATLRAEGNWTPILMLTAKAGEWDEAEALDTGADDFLSKPFSYIVLLAHLRALLRRGRRERPAILTAGDLELDPARRVCRRSGQEIALSPREWALLEYLIRRAGEVVSKSEIIDHVWDFDFRGDDNIVEVYIRYLRRKIDVPFGRSGIETVRGAGTAWPLMVADSEISARTLRARLGSVRARSTLVAVVVVGVALALGGLALVGLVRGSLTEGVESTAQAQARDVAALLRVGQLPAELPTGRGGTFTQVVSADGHVLASTASLLATIPISRAHPGEEGSVLTDIPLLSDEAGGHDDDGPYLLLSDTVTTAAGTETVYVAGSLRSTSEATETLAGSLAIGLPVLLALVGLLVWTFTGRALRPVEAIRREVADISGHRDLHRRVPTPVTNDEIGRLALTMNGMLDRLEASTAAQQRFVADASHELRSPLSALQTTLEVALAHPDSSAWPDVASDALDEARRLHTLVEDLLALARTEVLDPALRSSRAVDLDETVFAEAARQPTVNGIFLDLHRVSGGRVRGDPLQLARLVQNLLSNAHHHAAHRVSVELSTEGDDVIMVVADDGPGIAPGDRQRIFERFARLDHGRSTDDGGAGLGLAIVNGIVLAHGGSVAVTDSRQGARFEVRLPAEVPEDPPVV